MISVKTSYLTKKFYKPIFSFSENSIVFQCKYARSVSANSQMTVAAPEQPIIGTGDLTYRMEIGEGITLGGDTEITISPNHSISGISPR